MKKIKILITALLTSAIAFTSIAQEKDMDAMKEDTALDTPTLFKDNGMSDDIDDTGVVGVSGWYSFNVLAEQMMTLYGANYMTAQMLLPEMMVTSTTLESTRPKWMNTEEIKEDVADFQKEFKEFANAPYADENEYRENLEEIAEQFEDLREEIDEVYMEYAEINREAYKEAQEEKKREDSRYLNKEAHEEYSEEIKELKEVRDAEDDDSRK